MVLLGQSDELGHRLRGQLGLGGGPGWLEVGGRDRQAQVDALGVVDHDDVALSAGRQPMPQRKTTPEQGMGGIDNLYLPQLPGCRVVDSGIEVGDRLITSTTIC